MNDTKNINPGPETQILGRDVGFMNECNTVCSKLSFFPPYFLNRSSFFYRRR